MEFSPAGFALLKRSEGLRTHTYTDVAGFPTIGYGHKVLQGESFAHGISEAQATDILAKDVKKAEASVTQLVKVPLTQGQFDALVDFVFNLGPGNLASSTLLKMLNAKNYDAAAEQLLRWDHAGGHELSALTTRRKAEGAIWKSTDSEPVTA